MTLKKLLLLTVTVALLLSASVFAAQNAVVTSRRAAIYQNPSEESPILEYADPGDKVRISNHHKDGFYKVKTKGGGYGWIWQAHVAIDQEDSNIKVANLEMANHNHEHRFDTTKKRIFIRGSGFFFALMSSDISNRLDYKKFPYYPSYGGFFDIGVGISDGMRILGRVGYYTGGKTVTKDTLNFSVTHSSIPILLGLEGDVYRGKRFDISSAVYVGAGLQSTTSVTATSASAPNAFTLQSTSLAALGNFSLKYFFSNNIAIVTELGALYSQTGLRTIGTDFNGSENFKNIDDGQLGKFRIRHVGPYASLGFQIAF